MWKWRQRGIFRQFLLSYVCVLIPMLVLNWWMVNVLCANRAEQVKAQVQSRLEYAGANIDDRINSYRKSSVMLANDARLHRYRMLNNVQDTREGLRRLAEVVGLNPEVYELFMVYDDVNVYSNVGMTRIDVFLSQHLKIQSSIAEEARVALQSGEDCILRMPQSAGDDWMLFHFPLRDYKDDGIVSANFVLSEKTLLHTLETTIADGTACLYLAPKDGAGALYSCSLREHVEQAPKGFAHIQSDSKYFSLAVYYDEETMLSGERGHWLIWCAAVALLMVLLSFYLSRRHYRPIEHLVNRARDVSNAPDGAVGKNEFDYLHETLSRMAHEGRNLNRQLTEERSILRQQSATLIFNGLVRDTQEILFRMEFIGASLETDHFAVVAIAADESVSLTNIRRRVSELLWCETEQDGCTVLLALIGLRGEDREGQERLCRASDLTAGTGLQVSVSSVWEDLERIAQARLEALEGLRSARKGEPVLHADASDEAMLTLTDALARVIEEGDGECAAELLCQLRTQGIGEHNEFRVRECVQRTVVAAVLREEGNSSELLTALEAADFSEEEDAWTILEEVIRRLCGREDRSDIVAAALDYIRQNFTCNDLSLDMVAEHCRVSSAYLSRLFKRRMGIRYIDYVTELRMTEAKNLLRGTTLPVSEIALRVGYLNLPSFRKKFKLVTGMSLSEYRQDNGRDE